MKYLSFIAFLAVSLIVSGSGLSPEQAVTMTAAAQTPTATPTPTSIPITQLKIGDYVQFGRYAGELILWRVIEDSANPNANVGDVIIGDPLLLSSKVICNKAFDAAGPYGGKGLNLWQTSNIRAWLNSSAGAGAVEWPCGNPPRQGKVSSNDYADEKGFLADGNFTEYERNLIKPVTQKALLYIAHRGLAEGGSIAYKYRGEIGLIVNNYDSAWYHNVTDKVFLLDPKQVNGVYNRFGSYYRDSSNPYWLRAPDTHIYTDSSPANVLYIPELGSNVYYRRANDGSMGVRPALTLNRELGVFGSGDGSKARPYLLELTSVRPKSWGELKKAMKKANTTE